MMNMLQNYVPCKNHVRNEYQIKGGFPKREKRKQKSPTAQKANGRKKEETEDSYERFRTRRNIKKEEKFKLGQIEKFKFKIERKYSEEDRKRTKEDITTNRTSTDSGRGNLSNEPFKTKIGPRIRILGQKYKNRDIYWRETRFNLNPTKSTTHTLRERGKAADMSEVKTKTIYYNEYLQIKIKIK